MIQSLIHFEEKDQRYVTLNVSAKHIIHLQETPHNSFDSSIFFCFGKFLEVAHTSRKSQALNHVIVIFQEPALHIFFPKL